MPTTFESFESRRPLKIVVQPEITVHYTQFLSILYCVFHFLCTVRYNFYSNFGSLRRVHENFFR